jgi:DNA repair protein RadC
MEGTRRSAGPRERLLAHGVAALDASDLLALVLRTGARRRDVQALARELAEGVGLEALARAGPGELRQLAGIGPAKAASVVAAVELGRRLAARTLAIGDRIRGPADVYRHYHARLRDAAHEEFHVVLLDARHRVMREVLVSRGTLTASLVHPREVFRPALREAAAAIVLAHNHPSGDPTPSAEDREITRRLARVGRLVGIAVVDHVVLGANGYVSLREEGALPDDASGE